MYDDKWSAPREVSYTKQRKQQHFNVTLQPITTYINANNVYNLSQLPQFHSTWNRTLSWWHSAEWLRKIRLDLWMTLERQRGLKSWYFSWPFCRLWFEAIRIIHLSYFQSLWYHIYLVLKPDYTDSWYNHFMCKHKKPRTVVWSGRHSGRSVLWMQSEHGDISVETHHNQETAPHDEVDRSPPRKSNNAEDRKEEDSVG